MVTKKPGREGAAWKQAVAQVDDADCYHCGQPIPPTSELAYGKWTKSPWNHPRARTIHHIYSLELCKQTCPQPCSHATDPANLVPSHRGCNSAASHVQQLAGTPSRSW